MRLTTTFKVTLESQEDGSQLVHVFDREKLNRIWYELQKLLARREKVTREVILAWYTDCIATVSGYDMDEGIAATPEQVSRLASDHCVIAMSEAIEEIQKGTAIPVSKKKLLTTLKSAELESVKAQSAQA